MAAYRRVYDSRHLQADCQEPGSLRNPALGDRVWAAFTFNYYTRLTALCPGLPGWAGTRKLKPIRILLKQETVNGSGISWAICKSAPRSRQITTPAPHHLSVFRGRMPFLSPNSRCQSTEGIRKCRKIGRLLERVITQSMSSTSIQQSKIQNVRRKRTKPKKSFFSAQYP